MGSCLCAILANVFLVYFGKNWRQNYRLDFKHDIFFLFTSPEPLEALYILLKVRHAIMSSTIENEKENRMCFLAIQIICEEKNVPLLSTVDRILIMFTHILRILHHLLVSLVLPTHSLINAPGNPQVRLSYTRNYFF